MSDFNLPPGVGVHDIPGNEKPKPAARKKKRRRTTGARWLEFFRLADRRLVAAGGYVKTGATVVDQCAAEIVRAGDGDAFLKAARRGRATQRQGLRYQLLREVERLHGDHVKRRRALANLPDALALKTPQTLELGPD